MMDAPDAAQFGFYPDVARHFTRREQHVRHDEELTAWLRDNRARLTHLARSPEEHALDAQDFAPALADVAGYMLVNARRDAASAEATEARTLFLRAAKKLYPEIAELTIRATPEGALGTLEQTLSLLESGDYHDVADRLRVEMLHVRRRPLADIAKAADAWEQVIVRQLDSDAYMAFKEERHAQIDADVAAEVRRQLSFGIEAVYFLERLRAALQAAPAPEVVDTEKNELASLRRETSYAIGFLGSRLTRHINISSLRLEDDVERWRALARGIDRIRDDYMHDADAAKKKSVYAARIDALLAQLRPPSAR